MLAVCGIVRRKGRVLMCRRSSSVPFPGRWELPTETLEDDEPAENALERVFFERLTVVPKTLTPLGAVDFTLGEGGRMLAYGVELYKDFVHIYGYDDVRWVKVRDLKRFRALEPHVTLLTGLNGAL